MFNSFEQPIVEKAVLITDDCHELLVAGFENAGFRVDFEPQITFEATKNRIANYEGLIINSKIWVDSAFLARAKRLKFVGRLGSGMEIVDQKATAERGILVVSSPEGNRNAVAEQAVGMLLALSNNLIRADRELRQKAWHREKNRGWELMGKTVGIIGYGHTGRQFAQKLSGFALRTLAFDKYLPAGFAENETHVEEVFLEKIMTSADIISLHLPLTTETDGFANQVFFEKCQPGFVLINTSRGSCVKTASLLTALESGHCAGACLDVFENEKPATFSEVENRLFERLYQLENVVLSPHIAGWTHESKQKMATTLLDKLRSAGVI